MSRLAPGDPFGQYRVEELIGAGGMGLVYRARDQDTGARVALKLIRPERAADPEVRARFLREARHTTGLAHPNLVRVLAAGEIDGTLFLTTEFVHGADLQALLATAGPLSPSHAVPLVSAVGDGLDAIHAIGLVHRDVKPANVLLADGGERLHPVLADFGLGRLATSQSGLTRTGMWVGTVAYAAPEQIRAEHVDARTDVYSLGCLLYEVLCGEPPFVRATDVATMSAHLGEPAPAFTDPALAPYSAVVQRAMAKEPDERFRSAGALGDALTSLVGTGPDPPAAVMRPRPSVPPIVGRDRPTAA